MSLEAIKYSKGNLEILDQLLLPHESKYIAVKNTEDGWSVIKNMQVPVHMSHFAYACKTGEKRNLLLSFNTCRKV